MKPAYAVVVLSVAAVATLWPGWSMAAAGDAHLVVTVNGTPISNEQVLAECDDRINASTARESTHGLLLDEANRQLARDAIRAESIHALIERNLIAMQLQRDGLTVTEAEVDAAFREKAELAGQSVSEARNELRSQRRTMAALRERLRWNVVGVSKLYEKHALAKVRLTEAEAREIYSAYPGEFDLPARRRVSHIFFRVPPGANERQADAARERAERVLAQLRGGAEFGRLAAAHSDDESTRSRGGDRGFSTRGVIVDNSTDPFGNAAFGLKTVGQISDVVQTSDGVHIIKLTAIEPARRQSFDEVKHRMIADFHNREVARFWEDYGANLFAAAAIVWSPAEQSRQAAAAMRQQRHNQYVESLIAVEQPRAVHRGVEAAPDHSADESQFGVPAGVIPASREK